VPARAPPSSAPPPELLLISPDEPTAGPQGAGTRRVFYCATSVFSKLPLFATAGPATRRDGLFAPLTVTAGTSAAALQSALLAVVTSNGVARAETDGSARAAEVLAEALVAAGDKLRTDHGQMRLCALVDARVRGGGALAGADWEGGRRRRWLLCKRACPAQPARLAQAHGIRVALVLQAAALEASASAGGDGSSSGGAADGDGASSSGGAAAAAAPDAPAAPAPAAGLPAPAALRVVVTQQNAISAALLQRPTEPLSALVERADVPKVLRTLAGMNMMLARQNGGGSVLVLPTEVDETPLGLGDGAPGGGGGLFSLRVQRVPPDARLPRNTAAERSGRSVLRVRPDTRPERLAVAIVGGVLVGEARSLEVGQAGLLPLALQGLARARARLLEKGSRLDLAAVVYQRRRRPREPGAEGDGARGGEGGAERGSGGSGDDEARGGEEEASGGERGGERGGEGRNPRRPGQPYYVLRLVTLEVPRDSGDGGSGGGSSGGGGGGGGGGEAAAS
jgi:hypothetical protein